MVGLDPGMAAVGREVGLQVVVHEAVVVEDAGGLELGNEFFRRGPGGGSVAEGFVAGEGG